MTIRPVPRGFDLLLATLALAIVVAAVASLAWWGIRSLLGRFAVETLTCAVEGGAGLRIKAGSLPATSWHGDKSEGES